MALFGPKDKNLPLLTTFFQVEDIPADYDDIQEVELFQWLVREKVKKSGVDLMPKPPVGQAQRDCFQRLVTLHPIIYRIMRALNEHGGAYRSDLVDLQNAYQSIPQDKEGRGISWEKKQARFDVTEGRWIEPPALIAPATIRISQWKDLPFDDGIGLEIIEEIVDHAGHPEQFAQCPECQSVYIRLLTRQVFCSHRCNSRAKVRRFREKAKGQELISA